MDEVNDECELERIPDSMVVNTEKMKKLLKANYVNEGNKLIKDGQVATVILAGGQGSRLGFEHPKGMFDIGTEMGKSIF